MPRKIAPRAVRIRRIRSAYKDDLKAGLSKTGYMQSPRYKGTRTEGIARGHTTKRKK